jgi:hypothetical protein
MPGPKTIFFGISPEYHGNRRALFRRRAAKIYVARRRFLATLPERRFRKTNPK